ncbi:MAG: hypothetical protein NTU60_11850 [Candidatus Aminicenantes bacterium]|nr:hypothetical protein [Candidatus Aminicenantes bacterium]
MNKHRTLKAVGFFVVLAVIVAFLALPNSQAAKGKPIKWKATVSGDMWASGEFVGGVDHVNINNGVGTNPESCGPAGNSYSYLELQLFTPSLQVNMNGFSGDYDLPSPYGFPKTIAKTWPDCVAEFLNSNFHPTPEYPHVILRFTTCGCGNVATDLMAMQDGAILPVHMMLLFFTHNWYTLPTSASTPVPYTFLNLNMNAHGYVKTVGSLPDIYIQRVGNVWTVHVDTLFDNLLYQDTLQDYNSYDWPVKISDNILGQYATYVPSTNKKGKTTWTTTYHYPRAKAPLQFQIAFTKY